MTSAIRREFLLYVGASVCALGADIALLATLVEFGHVHYLLAASASFLTGTVVSYLLCTSLVFRFRRITRAAPEFGAFLTIGVVGLGLNMAVMTTGVELLNMHFLLAKIGAAGVTFLANFLLRKLLLFTPSSTQASVTRTSDPSVNS